MGVEVGVGVGSGWVGLNIKMLPYRYRDPHVKDKT